MSLILEALRKSEAERRRDSAPDVALELPPAPARTARSAPPWLWPVLAVVVALAALGGWLGSRLGDRGDAAPAPVAQTAPSAGMPRIVPRPDAAQPPVSAPTPGAATATPISAVAAMPTTATIDPTPMPHPTQSSSAVPPPAAPASTSSALDAPDIAATALPPIKLSMHMWDADPARRFVILDGQRMGEGDRSGGLDVIAIDRKGVTIERDGQRAHVPLP
ncbi:general secretion pathway protein GspB [Thermomonas brevis]|uniref:General secretion pathway protein GspB n=1 Tax=Thermomonas brevis TaxID=215691 RepID=A0A7G9QRN9_9GAMM|nr:general secretion pathway protein GspB [Thermomonas brevis]QNN46014.1 general secretion pathway protein GspB [Thermomonas brevis]